MEVENTALKEFDTAHPNYERWKRARDISIERGKFVKSIVSNFIVCKNLKVLDIGSGEGATAKVFADENIVVSMEKNPVRLKKQVENGSDFLVIGDGKYLPLQEKIFDLIILQDSIEHLNFEEGFFEKLNQLLKEKGIIYLSTPNKYSIFNILADPHWGLPIVSLLSRKNIKNFILRHLRKKDYLRDDIAELFSLSELKPILEKHFQMTLNTKFAVKEIINGNKGLIWSNFHLALVGLIEKIHIKNLLVKIANDKNGIINKFFTPTFYLILKKKHP
ncbi:MAG: class I SAM-dependent methyltransferase [Ignavibacteria bacterium]|nr:class I SAM-dependent methyltransferase [Ignavibacteria bacterium]MBT8381663.1 class I SAM-dependent methyltransferase [Ignavibacteria bacterium]MBT8390914.1 class I SAM-dependent methyltransferase [Ignavibacteria bacterium]NNJ53927.1 class I SAM-dependent methyltransferase [Ignavibacteriaceae bacterium]NNL20580.1 class I SAM-dependent methyltransferase [Ignavibacteriaceae bacterium]